MNVKLKFLFAITFMISLKEVYTSQSNPIIVGNENEIKSQEKIDIIGGVSGVLGQIGNIGNGGINTIINQSGNNRIFLRKNIYHIRYKMLEENFQRVLLLYIIGVKKAMEQLVSYVNSNLDAITDQMTQNFLMALSGLIFGVVSFIMVTVVIIYECLTKNSRK